MTDELPDLENEPDVIVNSDIKIGGNLAPRAKVTGLLVERARDIHVHGPKQTIIPLDLPGRPEVLEGREPLIDAVLEAFAPGKVVTLVRPGGIGKSTLAAELVWRLCRGKLQPPEDYPDEVIWHTFYNQKIRRLG
jgi:hypothetical protein